MKTKCSYVCLCYLSWLLASGRYCGPQVDGGSPGVYGLRDAGGEGWSSDDNPGLSRVGGLWGISSLSAWYCARAGYPLCWVVCWGCSSHGSSLVRDLVHNGLHELRGQSWQVDRCHPWIQRGLVRKSDLWVCVLKVFQTQNLKINKLVHL